MGRSRVAEIILQRQTSQRKCGMPLDWDEDLTRLARDPSLSTDHRIRVCIHRGKWIGVQVALDTETNVPMTNVPMPRVGPHDLVTGVQGSVWSSCNRTGCSHIFPVSLA